MIGLRYDLPRDLVFYALVAIYAYGIGMLAMRIWMGVDVDVFGSYSAAADAEEKLRDANRIYFAKSAFLFTSLFLYAVNVDYRAAIGVGAIVWSTLLIVMFGPTPVLWGFLALGVPLVGLQLIRGEFFTAREGRVFSRRREEGAQ